MREKDVSKKERKLKEIKESRIMTEKRRNNIERCN